MRGVLPWVIGLTLCADAQFETELAPREVGRSAESGLPFGGAGADEVPAGGGEVVMARLNRLTLTVATAAAGGGAADGGNAAAGGDAADRESAADGGDAGGPGPDPRRGARQGAPPSPVTCAGLTVDRQDALERELAVFLGQPLTLGGLHRIIATILRHYESHGRPVVDVWAPQQSFDGGRLVLEVLEGTIGAVGIQTVGIFDDRLLGRGIRLEHGGLLRSADLQEHLDWYNRNPFRPVALYAAPGFGPGEADLVFSFAERRPWRFYAGYENTGAEVAGEDRYFAGVNWGNAFGLDQILNYQFTRGDAFNELQAHSVVWELPIHPWHHFLRLRGAWADITSESMSQGTLVKSDGTSWMAGGAYGLQLPRWHGFRQEIAVGGEFKSADNFLVFGEVGQPGTVVEVVQFRADYLASRRFERSALELGGALVASPGGLAGRNHDDDFEAFRPGARATYLYGRAHATWIRQLPRDWTLRLAGQLQLASGALLPTEQLGMGGYNTIRGYEERLYLADWGYAATAELRTPAYELPGGKWGGTRLQILAFLDQGVGWRDEILDGIDDHRAFLGTGAGLRLQIGTLLTARADLGVPLRDARGTRAHLGLTLAF